MISPTAGKLTYLPILCLPLSSSIFCFGVYKSHNLLLLPPKPIVGLPSLQGLGSLAECERGVVVR